MFSECKIFSIENILHKVKHFLLFDYVVEITLENYFLCLVLVVKNLFSENGNINQLPATTAKDKHNPPPPTQNLDREEGKNRHHRSIAITTHRSVHHHPYKTHQNTTTHTKHNNNKIKDQTKQKSVNEGISVREKWMTKG